MTEICFWTDVSPGVLQDCADGANTYAVEFSYGYYGGSGFELHAINDWCEAPYPFVSPGAVTITGLFIAPDPPAACGENMIVPAWTDVSINMVRDGTFPNILRVDFNNDGVTYYARLVSGADTAYGILNDSPGI